MTTFRHRTPSNVANSPETFFNQPASAFPVPVATKGRLEFRTMFSPGAQLPTSFTAVMPSSFAMPVSTGTSVPAVPASAAATHASSARSVFSVKRRSITSPVESSHETKSPSPALTLVSSPDGPIFAATRAHGCAHFSPPRHSSTGTRRTYDVCSFSSASRAGALSASCPSATR